MSTLPSYRASLAPEFDPQRDNAVSAINIEVRLIDSRSKATEPLLTLFLNVGSTPTLRYDGDALKATDDSGHLPLTYRDSDEGVMSSLKRAWIPERDPVGPVLVKFQAVPRHTEPGTLSGPRVDLRTDQGGGVGMGYGFLPHPPADDDWEVQIDFDMPDSAPAGTRGACSLGDSMSNKDVGRPQKLIGNALFAVGKLTRYPSWETETGIGQEFSMYWIGDPPYDMKRVAPLTESLFRSIASFFGDTTNSFRVFVRRVWSGHGGSGGYRSFLLEYSPGSEDQMNENDLLDLLAHETVHEYPLMNPIKSDDAWYNEGVANYYATIAAFEKGAVNREYLIRLLNNNTQAYYTTQVIGLEWKYITDHYMDRFDYTKAGYGRGFIYLAQVQGLISRETGGQKGVGDVVLKLYERQLRHVETHSDDFHELVSGYIGKEKTAEIRAAMEGGQIIVPPEDSFKKYGLKLVRHDVEQFEAGFDPNSLRTNKIKGLVKGSRAEQAGLREDDEVASAWMLWGAGDALENMMQVTVRRNGEEIVVNYWPRSHVKVENYMWIEDGDARSHI
ncbi:uncharacterized protein JN550_009637 [Neoarthrinium moseri]|uniref:uncharacterized protein n=1 Tax=Neoarthrinium moseri TaxID=1658444 RepID=UPI001FDE121F|nr:uncharacterized protein JN550_009637 [Neoarthrinium moseri]KAI1863317.1 hypothetical protein JN550_009637 [Neoarthrinium moseri]